MKNILDGRIASIAVAAALAAAAHAEQDVAQKACSQLSAEEMVGQLMMDSPAVPKLGLEKYHWWNEALHGVARAGLATVFPQSMAMAATFDTELEQRMADAISTEARAKYNLFQKNKERGIYTGLTFWSPNVNMFRDPRWGRGQETFGEDPYLASAMGVAFVKGMQGNDPKYLKTAACAKHFAVHSGPEALRHGFDARVSMRDMAEYYLPAFKALVVEGKVESVMGAYSAINGVPCCANKWLLTDLLRGEWGFKGHVVSDVGAVSDVLKGHHYTKDQVDACKATIAAGLDLCSEGTYGCLRKAVKDGRVKREDLVVPLERLYRTRAKLGHFDPPGSTPWDKLGAESVANDAHRAIALEAAEKSMVLVHNNGVLPLNPAKCRCIGVVGPRACDEVALLGNYNGYSSSPVTCLPGIALEAGPGVRVDQVALNNLDVVVACIGLTTKDEGEEGDGGDRKSYGLPGDQIKLLKSHRRGNRKVIAVVFGCSPLDLKPLEKLCDAVIVAWYPGEQGGRALGRLLFGKANFSGRLPITYPTSYADLPDFKSYALEGRTYMYGEKAAYPFGYGLSYTKFSYSDLKIEKTSSGAVAEVVVKNTGKVAGDEVVQVYVSAPKSAKDRRVRRLAGFARVTLAPGEAKKVKVELPKSRFEVYGEDGRPFVPEGESVVFVGGGQPGFAQGLVSYVSFSGAKPRAMIHSHNDYAQKRPFWGAYEAGADSIEADVYLVDGELVVAHMPNEIKPENTLRRLYLEPIRSLFEKNGGKIRADGKPLQLVIDIKEGKASVDRLVEMIEKEGLRPCFDIKNNPSAVRLVSGTGKADDLSAFPDYLFFTVSPDMKMPAELYGSRIVQMTQSGRKYTKWRKGKMSPQDKAKIRAAIDDAHARGCNFRLWGFPDNPEAWKIVEELRADYINTDHPDKLAEYLR